tara:strand:- start:3455 stop:3790 length:336 start_codon:yes stop_codon:yes gene_type:complete
MMKNFAFEKTPKTSDHWVSLDKDQRKKLVENVLKKNQNYSGFEVYETPNDGQIILKIQKSISSNIRGLMLLELESKLKENVDKGLTVWLEPVGDKSKLRNLRGIKIKPENN